MGEQHTRNRLSIKNKFDINDINKYSQKDIFISICNNTTKISYIRFNRFINNKFSNDLNFNSGDIVVIKGISGSGKTSFLDSFVGLTVNEKNSWEINCKNKNIILDGNQGFGLLNQIISYSPQDPTIFEASLFENLLLGVREIDFAPSKKDIDMINFWLKEMKIDYLAKREFELNKSLKLSLNPFSAGEMQRLCLIRTFLRNKQIEVHDDPTSNLDLSATKNIRDIIFKRSRNRFTLITTHDPILINIATKVISL